MFLSIQARTCAPRANWSDKIHRIDLLMLSHPHVDHIFVVTRCAREWPAAIESFGELFMLRNKQVVYAHDSAFELTGSRPL